MTQKQFIEKARKVHGDKYDYSKVDMEHRNKDGKICIICHEKDENGVEHGEFWQTPHNHLIGNGCIKCFNETKRGKKRQHDIRWFISKSRQIHGDKYDYSKVEYKRSNEKVCIICPEHGEFWQTPHNHIWDKNGCDKCGGSFKNTIDTFIEKARKVHGNKYDYSKVEYVNNKTKVCIICPEHGEFWQRPDDHLNGHGCKKCKSSRLERELRIFFEEHNVLYEERKTFYWLKFKKHQYLDFYLPDYNVAIECQGEQHFQKSGWGKGDIGEKNIIRDLNKLKLCNEHYIKMFYYSNLKINYPYKVYEDKNEMLNDIISIKKK